MVLEAQVDQMEGRQYSTPRVNIGILAVLLCPLGSVFGLLNEKK